MLQTPPVAPQAPTPLPPPDIPPEVVAWLQQIPPELAVLVPLVAMTIAGGLLYIVVRAISRRIEGGVGIRALREEVEALRQRVAEMDDSQVRLAELEDRVDFSERLLAQQAPAAIREDRHG